MNKKTIKRYAISSGVTFLSTFLLVVGSSLSVEAIDEGAIIGILIVAIRAGVKATVEQLNNKLKKASK